MDSRKNEKTEFNFSGERMDGWMSKWVWYQFWELSEPDLIMIAHYVVVHVCLWFLSFKWFTHMWVCVLESSLSVIKRGNWKLSSVWTHLKKNILLKWIKVMYTHTHFDWSIDFRPIFYRQHSIIRTQEAIGAFFF